MKIRLKLTLGYLVIAALVAVVGLLAAAINEDIHGKVQTLRGSAIVEVVDASEMTRAMTSAHVLAYELLAQKRQLAAVPADDDAQDRIDETRRDVQASLTSFRESLNNSRNSTEALIRTARDQGDEELAAQEQEELTVWIDRLDVEFAQHSRLIGEFLRLANDNIAAAELFLRDRLQPHYRQQMLPLIDAYKRNAEQELNQAIHGVEDDLVRADRTNRGVALVALSVSVLLGLLIARSIGGPLARIQAAVAKIGGGDLDTKIVVTTRDEIGMLSEAFNQMTDDLRATTVSKNYVEGVLQSMQEMLIVVDSELRIERVNRATCDELGFSEDELQGKPLASLIADADVDSGPSADLTLAERLIGGLECDLIAAGGKHVVAHCSGSELRDSDGRLTGMVCVATNIAERKAAEQKIRDSLAEKEVLLREVHHRVKNNLQIISSLLNLQSREAGDDVNAATAIMFRESQNRIRSMALIHEQLYQSDDLARIDFAEYVRELTNHVRRVHDLRSKDVEIHVDVDRVQLPIDLAIPCGLIINELLSNALKHAFPEGRAGQIDIAYRVIDGQHQLVVFDNGVGIDEDGPAGKSPKPLGLKVIDALVGQLGGQLEVDTSDGTKFCVRYNEKESPATK